MNNLSVLAEAALASPGAWREHACRLRIYWGPHIVPVLSEADILRRVRSDLVRWLDGESQPSSQPSRSNARYAKGGELHRSLLRISERLRNVIVKWARDNGRISIGQGWIRDLERVVGKLSQAYTQATPVASPARANEPPAPAPSRAATAARAAEAPAPEHRPTQTTDLCQACHGQPRRTNEMLRILGVEPTCNEQQLRERYRVLAQRYHPDRGGSSVCMAAINIAYMHIAKKLRSKMHSGSPSCAST